MLMTLSNVIVSLFNTPFVGFFYMLCTVGLAFSICRLIFK